MSDQRMKTLRLLASVDTVHTLYKCGSTPNAKYISFKNKLEPLACLKEQYQECKILLIDVSRFVQILQFAFAYFY